MNAKNSRKISQDAEAWLVACLDPYHDYQYDIEGLPDQRSAPSVVQIHNQSYSLTIPASAAGGNWDASVLFTGINRQISDGLAGGMITVPNSLVHEVNSGALNAGAAFGALNIWAGGAGATMSTGSPFLAGETYAQLGSVMNTDRCRLIGAGIEIHNTTAEIYKQGSLTVAQLPDVAEDNGLVAYIATAGAAVVEITNAQADRCCVQACTVGPLQSVPGACVWPAAQGVYAVPRMVSPTRNIQHFSHGGTGKGGMSRIPVLYGTDGKTATPEPVGWVSSGIFDQFGFVPFGPNGFAPMQIFFNGLSAQTTLTITFRTIVEYFPSVGSSLLPLASPSPTYDVLALQVYSQIITQAPYAVPVDQNESGDYFKKILALVSRGLGLMSPMFGELAPMALLASSLGKEVVRYVDKRAAGKPALQKSRK